MSTLVILLLSAVVAVHGVTLNPAIVLRPADTSVAQSQTLPLSCVATAEGDPVSLQWQRRNDTTGQLSAVDIPPITQMYTSMDGSQFHISTIVLCNVGFGNEGMYICGVSGSNVEERIQVSVHVPTTANFQLRLTGVGNCGIWVASDASSKSQSIVDQLRSNVLNSVCTDPQLCSYNITSPGFSCVGDTSSNSVTFSATIDHRRESEASNQEASSLVNTMGAWKDGDSSTLMAGSLTLTVESSCDIDGTTPCGTSPDESLPLGPVVGGAVGGVALICVIILIVVVAVVITMRCSKRSLTNDNSYELKPDKDYAHVDVNIAYGTSMGYDKRPGVPDRNPPGGEMEEYTPMDVGVYDNDNPTEYEQPVKPNDDVVYDYIADR